MEISVNVITVFIWSSTVILKIDTPVYWEKGFTRSLFLSNAFEILSSPSFPSLSFSLNLRDDTSVSKAIKAAFGPACLSLDPNEH